jgi:phosphopantetheine--protein transferase-like protein
LPPVGNDVVDLAAACNLGKSGDGRFCSRVFTAEERALIAGAPRPDTLLWALWAAKEAAYKAVSRGEPAIGSIPRQYRVVLEPGDAAGTAALLRGKVITPRGEMAIRIAVTAEWVHALAASAEADIERLCQCVDRLEETGDDADPSAFVRRNLLREIARRLDCPVGDLSVANDPEGPGVPRILFRGRLLAAEVSISHDGRFTAFAFDPAALLPAKISLDKP